MTVNWWLNSSWIHGLQMNNRNIVIYTAIFGNYDGLIEPDAKYEHCDFVCFTDNENVSSKIWKIVLVKNKDVLPNMQNRYYKLHPHQFFQDYEVSIYIDSNIIMWNSPLILVDKYMSQFSIAAPIHPLRNCLYKEAEEVIKAGKAPGDIVKAQMLEYIRGGFPKDFGLCEMNIIIRKHNELSIIKLMDDWWHELTTWSKRDQLGFYYVVWKNNMKVGAMKENSREYLGDFFVECHLNDRFFNKAKRKVKKIVIKIYRYFSRK